MIAHGVDVDPPRPPGATRILPILLTVPVVAAAVFGAALRTQAAAEQAAVLSAVSAAIVGTPLLFWALDHGFTRLRQLAPLGAVAGALPPLAALASGLLGHFLRVDLAHVRWVVRYGAPIPWYGQMRWADFLVLGAQATLVGATSAVIYWCLLVDRRRARATRWLCAVAALALAVAASALLG